MSAPTTIVVVARSANTPMTRPADADAICEAVHDEAAILSPCPSAALVMGTTFASPSRPSIASARIGAHKCIALTCSDHRLVCS